MTRYLVCGEPIMDYSSPEPQPSGFEAVAGSSTHAAVAPETPTSIQGTCPRPRPLRLNLVENGTKATNGKKVSEPDSPTYQNQADAAVLSFPPNGVWLGGEPAIAIPRQRLVNMRGDRKELETTTEMHVGPSSPRCLTPGKLRLGTMPSPSFFSENPRIRQWLGECHEAVMVPLNSSDSFQSRTLGLSNHRALQEVRSLIPYGNRDSFVDFDGSYFAEEVLPKTTPSSDHPDSRTAKCSNTLFMNDDELAERPGTQASDASSSSSYSTHPDIREVFTFFRNLSVEEVLERREEVDFETLQRELAIYDLALPQRPVQLKNRSLSAPRPLPTTPEKVKRRPRPLNIQFSPLLSFTTQRLSRANNESPLEPEVSEPMLSLAEALAATEVDSPSEMTRPSKSDLPRRSVSMNLRASTLFSQSASAVSGLRKSISSPLHDIPRRLSAAFSFPRSSRIGEGDDDASDCSSTVSSVIEILPPPSRWSMSTSDSTVESPLKRTWGSIRRRTMSPR